MDNKNILEVKNLRTSFFTHLGEVQAVRGISYELKKGGILGIVGESGSGKSVSSLSLMRLVDDPGKIVDGEIIFDGVDLVKLSPKEIQDYRGKEIAMIFQDPMTSLNPVYTIKNQMMEVILRHVHITAEKATEEANLIKDKGEKEKALELIEKGVTRKLNKEEALERAIHYLRLVGIPEPETRIKEYPHQFSGGMRQRALVAMALSCEPKLIIADEPTTALDVTIQAQILDLLKKIKKELDTTIIFITHDLGVIAELCQDVIVMYGGMIMEKGSVDDIFYNPQHPYTKGLHQSIPKDVVGQKKRLVPIAGSPPDLLNPPKGCPFSPRCRYAMEICIEKAPPLYKISDTQVSACWLQDKNAPDVEGFTKSRGENNE
ncbi:MAG: ABC transporter ATP-binding protein [Candidatus Izemoplasmatales bacterium]|jgi:oligopeptide transport system ATP-binding protein